MPREYFCAYHSYLKGIKRLSEAERGRLFTALLQYSAGEEELIKLQGREEVLFDVYSDQIDRDSEKYEEKCRKNRENGSKANGTERGRTVPNAPQDKDKGKDKDNIKEKNILKKETRHQYGEYQNVLLSDEEMEKLKAEFPDYQERIERLSEYCAQTGKSYKNYLATIRVWAKKEPKPEREDWRGGGPRL
ncbi:DUF6291 domain-containing protein [Massiliimalia timonensis]|uniref:DUF6291 domain-containing protein n=1 Tax=Massiliimalia timonensis TaxID=1987501 RepID=UPI001E36D421|nr:DUF6291 domain-containing protein [Massiliimalia timonensis]